MHDYEYTRRESAYVAPNGFEAQRRLFAGGRGDVKPRNATHWSE